MKSKLKNVPRVIIIDNNDNSDDNGARGLWKSLTTRTVHTNPPDQLLFLWQMFGTFLCLKQWWRRHHLSLKMEDMWHVTIETTKLGSVQETDKHMLCFVATLILSKSVGDFFFLLKKLSNLTIAVLVGWVNFHQNVSETSCWNI